MSEDERDLKFRDLIENLLGMFKEGKIRAINVNYAEEVPLKGVLQVGVVQYFRSDVAPDEKLVLAVRLVDAHYQAMLETHPEVMGMYSKVEA